MPDDATQQLARFAASVGYDAVPVRVREYGKTLLLDAFACALAGYEGEQTQQIAALACALGQSSESSVIGGAPLSLAGATLQNGFLITAVTMCEVHFSTLSHVTPSVVPPALAIAERDGLSGRELLLALIVGYEVATRIGVGLDYPAFRARGWHGDGVIGPFGGAAAVGRLLGFDASTMAMAFGLAGSQAAGTFAAWGTPTMKFHQARGALSGLLAGLLAHQQFASARAFLTAPDGGLYHSYSNGGRPEAVVADLGNRWELEQIALRLWPTASLTLGAMTALFELVEVHALTPERIARLRVHMSKTAFDMHGGHARYQGKFEAILSTHYAAAAILHERALSLRQFEPSHYDDPRVRAFAVERVEAVCDAALAGSQARVEAQTQDGQTIVVCCDHPRGAPENPVSREQIEQKFRTYAAARLSDAAIDGVVAAVAMLDTFDSVGRLMALLRVPAERRT